jgi:hypothetical protein
MNPVTVDGAPSDDGRITIPFNFHLPPKTWAQKMGLMRWRRRLTPGLSHRLPQRP